MPQEGAGLVCKPSRRGHGLQQSVERNRHILSAPSPVGSGVVMMGATGARRRRPWWAPWVLQPRLLAAQWATGALAVWAQPPSWRSAWPFGCPCTPTRAQAG